METAKHLKICVPSGTETMMTLLSLHNTRDYVTDRPRLTRPTLIMSLGAADSVAVCRPAQEEHFQLTKQPLDAKKPNCGDDREQWTCSWLKLTVVNFTSHLNSFRDLF